MSGEEASTSGATGDAERQRLAEKYGARDAHLTYTKEQLERMVDRVLDSNETVKYLMESLRLGGCPVDRNFFQARPAIFAPRALPPARLARQPSYQSRRRAMMPIRCAARAAAGRRAGAAASRPPPRVVRRRPAALLLSASSAARSMPRAPRSHRAATLLPHLSSRAGGQVHAGRGRRLLDGAWRHSVLKPAVSL
jgi:hypothetical protein